MTTPVPLPASGSTSWYTWAQQVDAHTRSWVDVRDYGAKVDGSTDDTTAIRAAVASFGTSGTSDPGSGGVVWIPPGYAMISGTLDLPSNVWLRGAGKSATCMQLLPNSNCHMITTHRSTGSGNSNAFWASVSDLMLDGRRDNQGAVLTTVTMRPGYTTLTTSSGVFAANNTLITGIGLLSGTTIVSGGGTNTVVISQAPTISALQQAPGAAKVYQGGTVDLSGSPVPWCGIYHETNPYNSIQTGDTQYDPTHTFENLRIYFMQGDGIRIHGRSDVVVRGVKVTVPTGNGFTIDFDTLVTDCMSEFAHGHGLELPTHSSNRVTDNKFYNSYGAGIYAHGGTGGELVLSGNDLQQNCWAGLQLESQTGAHFSGAISDAGFSNAFGGNPRQQTWTASTAYGDFRSGPHPDLVVPTVVNGYVYAAYIAGTSSTTQPTWPTTVGNTVVDGTVTWVCLANAPAAVGMVAATNCVVDAIAQNDLNGLRITGASTNNSVRLTHTRALTGSVDVSTDSITLAGSTNHVTVNGSVLTGLASLADVVVSAPADGNVLTYSSSSKTWSPAAGSGGGGGSPSAMVARLTTGDVSLNNVNWTVVSSSLDLTLAAAAGDWLEVSLDAKVVTEAAAELNFDAYTMVGGTPTNWVSTSTAVSGSHYGEGAWTMPASYRGSISGSVLYQLQAGDISGGNVVVRLVYYTNVATARTVAASASASGWPLAFHGKIVH